MSRPSTLCALMGFALIQCLSLAMPGKVSAAEPVWWTQRKAECGLSPYTAYNDWVAQGSPCNSGGGTTGGGLDPRQQLGTAIGKALAPVIERGVHDLLWGNHEQQPAQTPAPVPTVTPGPSPEALAAERKKVSDAKLEDTKNTLLGHGSGGGVALMGVEDSPDLKPMNSDDYSDVPLMNEDDKKTNGFTLSQDPLKPER